MQISIKKFFFLISILLLVIGVIGSFYITELHRNSEKLKDIEHNRHLMIQKADELRQSSDDLTRFARIYVVTGDKKYLNNYFNVLDIRNAKAKRPANYCGIYWDLSEKLREDRHPLLKKISLDSEMKKLPYNKFEYKMLSASESNSNDLVNLEMEAFRAMKWLDKDNETINYDINQTKAIKILHSSTYHKAKEKIMLPIDKFLFSVQERTQNSINVCNAKIENTFDKIFIILFIGFFIFVITIIMVFKKILIPIEYLTDTITSFKKGDNCSERVIYYDDEIGKMTEQFFEMKKKLDDDYNDIRQLSLTDPLTGIANRRSFFEVSKQCLKLIPKTNKSISIMIIDIDLFKKVNDTYGHLIGDEILKFLVKNIKKCIRKSDVFARFGGEEFIILLPNTNIEDALTISEKIRIYIESKHYHDENNNISITVSIGVTEADNKKDEKLSQIINRADKALYIAKENGRNKVQKG